MACDGDPPGDGALQVIFVVQGEPDIDELRIELERIDVVHSETIGGEQVILTVSRQPEPIVLAFQSTETARHRVFLGVRPGFVHQVRFVTRSATVVMNRDPSLTLARGQQVGARGENDVKVPSGPQTGLKVNSPPGSPFSMATEALTRVEVAFSLADKLVRNRGEGFILKPTYNGRPLEAEETFPPFIAPGAAYVVFRDGTSQQDINAAVASVGAMALYQHPTKPWVTVSVPVGSEIASVMGFEADSNVAFAAPRYSGITGAIPTEWDGGVTQDYLTAIRAPDAWNIQTGKRAVIAAILDNNFNPFHAEIQENLAFNPGEIVRERVVEAPPRCDRLPQGVAPIELPPLAEANNDGVFTIADFNLPPNRDPWLALINENRTARGLAPASIITLRELYAESIDACEWLEDGFDQDSNGCVDDLFGCDFTERSSAEQRGDNDLRDPSRAPTLTSHGTVVAAVLGAVEDSESIFGPAPAQMVGVSWRVGLVLVRVVGERGDLFDHAHAGLNYAIERGATVVNMSAGGACVTDIDLLPESVPASLRQSLVCTQTIEEIRQDWAQFVATAGASNVLFTTGAINESIPFDRDDVLGMPSEAGIPNQITATTVNDDDTFPSEEERVPFGERTFHIGAPGQRIPRLTRADNARSGTERGTSFAAPQVAGAAALLAAQNPARFLFQPIEMKRAILDSAARIEAFDGKIEEGRRLDVRAALEIAGP